MDLTANDGGDMWGTLYRDPIERLLFHYDIQKYFR